MHPHQGCFGGIRLNRIPGVADFFHGDCTFVTEIQRCTGGIYFIASFFVSSASIPSTHREVSVVRRANDRL